MMIDKQKVLSAETLFKIFVIECRGDMTRYIMLPIFLLCMLMVNVHAQTEKAITAQTIMVVEQIYTFEGECTAFHPAESYFATTQGLFNLQTGNLLFQLEESSHPTASPPRFSPDGRWIISGGTILEVETGNPVHTFEDSNFQVFRFSDNGLYAHAHGRAFALPGWSRIEVAELPNYEVFRKTLQPYHHPADAVRIGYDFKIGNGVPSYLSPANTYWVVVTGGLTDTIAQGIHNVRTGQLLELPAEFDDPIDAALLLEMGVFTPDERIFLAEDVGTGTYTAYHVPSFEQAYTLAFDIGNQNRLYASFSENALYFGFPDDAIYETITGKRLFEISGNPVFAPDNTWVAAGGRLYGLPDGRLAQSFSNDARFVRFSNNGELVAITPEGIFKRFDIANTAYEVFFSTDSSLLYVPAPELILSVYDTATGEQVAMWDGYGMTLSQSEQYLALNTDEACHIYGVG